MAHDFSPQLFDKVCQRAYDDAKGQPRRRFWLIDSGTQACATAIRIGHTSVKIVFPTTSWLFMIPEPVDCPDSLNTTMDFLEQHAVRDGVVKHPLAGTGTAFCHYIISATCNDDMHFFNDTTIAVAELEELRNDLADMDNV